MKSKSTTVIPVSEIGRARPAVSVPEIAVPATGRLLDRLGRPLTDLRISVTDRCNFRCSYCMPKDVFDKDYQYLPHSALLSFEEMTRLARLFAAHGVRKIRLTGGEPLLRKNIEGLIGQLSELRTPTGEPLALTLTTNGSLLQRKPAALHAAGLGPLKVNMVVKRGTNEQEILPMARYFRDNHGGKVVLRFIEYMDVGATNGWRMDEVLPSADVIARIGAEFPLAPLEPSAPGETAQRWAYADGGGEIGVISSVTQAFCHDCSRARLSTEGKLYLCLFASAGHDLRPLLRGTATDDDIASAIGHIWQGRADRYSELRALRGPDSAEHDGNDNNKAPRRVEMSYIGG